MVPGSSPTAATPRDGLIALGIAALVVATVLIAHLAPASPRHPAATPSVDETCAEWGDGCRVCQRTSEGTAACSTPGIACVPGEKTCLRRKGG